MPRIVARRPDCMVSVDLSGGINRMVMAATPWHGVACLTLACQFVPAQLFLLPAGSDKPVDLQPYALVPLARARVPFAKELAEVAKVADATLGNGSEDADIHRMREAFNLFRNGPRVQEGVLAAVAEESAQLVRAWWLISAWMLDGMAGQQKQMDAAGSLIALQP